MSPALIYAYKPVSLYLARAILVTLQLFRAVGVYVTVQQPLLVRPCRIDPAAWIDRTYTVCCPRCTEVLPWLVHPPHTQESSCTRYSSILASIASLHVAWGTFQVQAWGCMWIKAPLHVPAHPRSYGWQVFEHGRPKITAFTKSSHTTCY
jgi:hypothetical protein